MKKLLMTAAAVASLAMAGSAMAQSNATNPTDNSSATSTMTSGGDQTGVAKSGTMMGSGTNATGAEQKKAMDNTSSATSTQNSGGDQTSTAASSSGMASGGATAGEEKAANQNSSSATSTQNSGGDQTKIAK